MKHLLVYVGSKDGSTTFGNLVVETNHRRLRKENHDIIEAELKSEGFDSYVLLNVIRVRSW